MSDRRCPVAILIAALGAIISLAIGSVRADDKDEAVRVRIVAPSVHGKGEAGVKEVATALEKLPSVKVLPHSGATPHFLIEFNRTKTELGELAKAIAAVESGRAKDETAAFLMLAVSLDKEAQANLLKVLANVKGVDAKKSEFPGGHPRIALDNTGGARFADALEAVKAAAPKK
jgi:hypothetical protein